MIQFLFEVKRRRIQVPLCDVEEEDTGSSMRCRGGEVQVTLWGVEEEDIGYMCKGVAIQVPLYSVAED